ncbi:hypothetical protein B4966_06355 [Rhodocyclaceae bacterium]|nr:hypothetical protein B4966_06355 [Rhodocyclaceae bacterium]
MSLDMRQFYQVFFEETEEHLANIEALLLRLDERQPSAGEVAEIFRAAHSIKGSSATFGFEDMAALTHELEDMLDRVRKGKLGLTRAMIDAGLEAVDVLRSLLDAHRGARQPDTGRAERLRQRLAALATQAPDGADRFQDHDDLRRYELVFNLTRVVAGSGLLVGNMLDELGRLGELEIIERPPAQQPEGRWRVRLSTRAEESALRAVLELVTDPGALHLTRMPPDAPDPASSGGFAEEAEDGSYTLFQPFPPAGRREGQPAGEPPVGDAEMSASQTTLAQSPPKAVSVASRSSADAWIRVGVDKVDQMIDLVGELVITRSILQEVANQVDAEVLDRLMHGLGLLERHTRALQESVMSIRMVSVSMVFGRFPRLVRELSARLGKRVRLQMEGEHNALDRGLVERIADPITHLVRNALDHGIEAPALRRAAGKPEEGRLVLRAAHQGSYILIQVEDDGAGLSRERILARAQARGLPVREGMSDAEVWQLICEPGLSTADEISDLSGRGVGMDVVKRNVQALGGQLEIRSTPGRGTCIGVRLPLTLAIVDGLIVGIGSERYVLPFGFVAETLQVSPDAVVVVGGQARMIRVRGDYLPVIELGRVLGVPQAASDWCAGIMVVVEAHGMRAAVLVDSLIDQQQVVIKHLGDHFRRLPVFSAATVLGNGKVALIFDVAGLLERLRSGQTLAA